MRISPRFSMPALLLIPSLAAVVFAVRCGAFDPLTQRVVVTPFKHVEFAYDADLEGFAGIDLKGDVAGPAVRRSSGQMVDVPVNLPESVVGDSNVRIIARIELEPVMTEVDGGLRPGDPWTRLGRLSVLDLPGDAELPDPDDENQPDEVELIRFITPFGGPATYEADLTPFAPALAGKRWLRLYVSTWMNPAWKVTVTLTYEPGQGGYRRPDRVIPVITYRDMTSDEPVHRSTVTIPQGLSLPRLLVLSTGHANDGGQGDEFISRTHILRVNGEEVVRWRPWRVGHAGLREMNPAAGRRRVAGRMLWSTDFDRSGWLPGEIVEPLIIPLPELTPGEHEIEIEIVGIRPVAEGDEVGGRGYWIVSAALHIDQPWPLQ